MRSHYTVELYLELMCEEERMKKNAADAEKAERLTMLCSITKIHNTYKNAFGICQFAYAVRRINFHMKCLYHR